MTSSVANEPANVVLYGIRQCDTTRKALKWLAGRGIAHRLHDLRQDGLERRRLETWLASAFAESLVNRRSTTWRQLGEAQKRSSGAALVRLLLDQPTLIKRPVVERQGKVISVGWSDEVERELLRTI